MVVRASGAVIIMMVVMRMRWTPVLIMVVVVMMMLFLGTVRTFCLQASIAALSSPIASDTCGYLSLKEMKLKIQVLSYTSHIARAPQPHAASDYHIR